MVGLLPGGSRLCPRCKGVTGVNCFCGKRAIRLGGLVPADLVPIPGGPDPCNRDPDKPNDGNIPIADAAYQCSLGVTLQPHIDLARRQIHSLGLRPYRVFLVWEKQQRDQTWKDVKRVELVPVELVALDTMDLELAEIGVNPEGAIRLTQISPVQVTEHDLAGKLDGVSLDRQNDPDQRFFYEVVKFQRCDGDPNPLRRRYVLGAEPYQKATHFGWRVVIIDNAASRGPGGEDRTFVRDDVPDVEGKVTRLRR